MKRDGEPAAGTGRHAFVLLPAGLDVEHWKRRYARGEVPDLTPYGYHNADHFGWRVSFGRASPHEGGRRSLVARALHRLCGFDLAHAWHNRRHIAASRADAIWLYTEREFLAVLLLRRLRLLPDMPVIAQSIWLADVWPQVGALRRAAFAWLMRRAEICAFNSPVNAAFARERGWGQRVELIDFGVSAESFPMQAPSLRREAGPIRVLAIGNDRHRDWPTLHAAFAQQPGFEVRVASTVFPEALQCDNIRATPGGQADMRKLYDWADVVIIPLIHNLHVSGCTVACESVALGKPVVASDTGGLDHYFGHDQFFFVPVGGAVEMRAAVVEAMARPEATEARIRLAQRRFDECRFTTLGYAQRHVELSEALLAHAPAPAGR